MPRLGALSALLTFAVAAPLWAQTGGHTNNILITGYWPPTNEMLRPWSKTLSQNPTGWIGLNWEGRGYDVYAYFPEFPNGTTGSNGRGVGDLEVDYQDTAADWAAIVAAVRPVAIITNSRANTTRGWELEPAAQRFRLSTAEVNPPGRTVPIYTVDYVPELRPTDVPIAAEPVGNIRNNTLPMQAIVDAVAAAIPSTQIQPFIAAYNPATPDTFDFGGGFLSGYISYLGCWYHDVHAAETDPFRCVAAGHIHVGSGLATQVPIARQATEITLRTLIAHVDTLVDPCRADHNDDGRATVQDIYDYLSDWSAGDVEADFNRADGSGAGVTVQDIYDFLSVWSAGC